MITANRLATALLVTSALSVPTSAFAQAQNAPGIPPGNDPGTDETVEQGLDDIDPTVDGDDVRSEPEAPDISIPGGTIVVTGRINRDPVRSSAQVLNVLSAEDIARTGEGDIAGALSRVSGLSVVGGGRVFVRGLGDRYSLALLNGLPLPSPEPLSRVVPLDIFPTNVVASSLVQKSYSANFPGEFGGGVINLTTRAVPTESFLRISGGVGADTETTFQNGLSYFGSDFDWFGFDNGNRDIPSNLQAFIDSGVRIDDTPGSVQEGIAAQLFPTNLVTLQRIGNLPANFSAAVSGGTSFEIGDGNYLGIIATASLSNTWRNRSVKSQQANTDLSVITSDFDTFITDNNVLVNGLLGFGFEFGENEIRFTNLYIRDTLKTARLGLGTRSQLGETGFDFADQQTAWFERQLIDSQFVGEFEFDDLSLDVRAGYARTDREAPFNTTFSYTRTNITDDTPGVVDSVGEQFAVYLNRASDTGLSSVSFDDLTEEQYFGGVDLSYRLSSLLTATVGYAYTETDRRSVRREFSPRAESAPLNLVDPVTGDPVTFTPDPRLIPIIGLRRPGDIINGATLALFDVRLDETSQFPAFDANLLVHAGYGIVRVLPTDQLTVELGVRYEDAEQIVALDQSIFVTPIPGSTPTNNVEQYWLPSATITYSPLDDLQLRAAASKTIARPQFRELVEQTYFDPESNRVYRGNPFLTDSELFNAELRAEYYLGGSDRFSVAAFYKKIDNPIESFITTSAGSLLTSYANAPEAELYGAEVEAVYGYDLYDLGGFFETKRVQAILNYTFTSSTLSVADADTTFVPPGGEADADLYFRDGAPLTGQADHIANVQFGIEDTERTEQAYILLNYASERVVSRGFQRPDVIEDPGLTVDFVARKSFEFLGPELEVEFEVRNIFGRGNFEFQENENNRIEINTYDRGTVFNFSLAAEF